ncbi:hypothetical protein [Oceanospirillum sediminis]|uniref:Uncharacterized protein n=1 Tax=Oceanospirillum sediminis TaxID=2760088 RepID=A0A839ISV9_9GAMM|nr:hypothetical protein [Oceanospirillum sediminis]MBB1487682.1 hypothetical protein [Oceanospirillum sediminis]
MSKYRSATSPELLARLSRWKEERDAEDAEFLADQMPMVLQDVAMVRAAFFRLKEKVALLEQEVEDYKEGYHQRQMLAEFEDDQLH